MVTKDNQYEVSLDKNAANYVPLTPLSFIERTKDVYPGYTALVYGDRVYSWLETYNRCLKFASALERHGIGVGDTVSILVIDIRDPDAILQEGEGECLGKHTYDEFIEAGSLD